MRKSVWTGFLAVAGMLAAAGIGLLAPSPASAYGNVCASIAVSATVVNPGETITVTGSKFEPNSVVHLTLYPKATGPSGPKTVFGPINTDASGKFTFKIVMPLDATGNQILTSD